MNDKHDEKLRRQRLKRRWGHLLGAQLGLFVPYGVAGPADASVDLSEDASQSAVDPQRKRRNPENARTRKVLSAESQGQSLIELPPESVQRRISDAIQFGVEEVLGNGGGAFDEGECLLYAAATALIASAVLERPYRFVVGSLHIQTAPGNVFGLVSNGSNTWKEAKKERFGATYHAWTVSLPLGEHSEYIDMSARHYMDLLENCSERYQTSPWEWSFNLPEFVWVRRSALPPWLKLIPDFEATAKAHAVLDHSVQIETASRVASIAARQLLST